MMAYANGRPDRQKLAVALQLGLQLQVRDVGAAQSTGSIVSGGEAAALPQRKRGPACITHRNNAWCSLPPRTGVKDTRKTRGKTRRQAIS